MGVFFLRCPTDQAGLTRVKTACFRLTLRARALDYAYRFHGVTDGPLLGAAVKKKTPMPLEHGSVLL